MEISNLSVYGVETAQKVPSSFFKFNQQMESGNNIGGIQKLYDNDQLPSKQLDNVAATQVHVSNNRGEIGARTNSLERQ